MADRTCHQETRHLIITIHRQQWRARSVHRYSRWRLWFYSHGRVRPYTFTWISKTNDVSLRSCQLTPSWKVHTSYAKRAPLLTRREPGQYRALEWHEGEQNYKENPRMGVLVEVTVCISCLLDLPLRCKENPSRRLRLSSSLFTARSIAPLCRR